MDAPSRERDRTSPFCAAVGPRSRRILGDQIGGLARVLLEPSRSLSVMPSGRSLIVVGGRLDAVRLALAYTQGRRALGLLRNSTAGGRWPRCFFGLGGRFCPAGAGCRRCCQHPGLG